MKLATLENYITEVSKKNKGLEVDEVYSVTNSEGFIKSTDYFDKKVYSKDLDNYKIVSKNQFAYNPSRINVGSIDYLKRNDEVVISPLYIVFECSDKLYPEYLKLFLKSPLGNLRIRAKTKGAVRDSLSFKSLSKIKIPLFPITEQIAIAKILNQTEQLIIQRRESIALLNEYVKSVFLELFGNPIKNEKKWVKLPLKEFGVILTGNTPPRNEKKNYSSNFIEWVKTDNITNDNTYVTQASEYLSELGLKKSRFVESGALLVACIAGSIDSIGRACLTDRRVAFNQQINAIQPNNEINPFFLHQLFILSKKYIQNQATKGMKKILTKGNFEQILMIKPPIALQTKFESVVINVEALKSQFQESLFEMENLFGSLSQRAFKGELSLDKIEIDSTILNEFKIVEKKIIPELNPAMLKFIEQSQKLQKLYEQQAKIAEQTTRFLKPIQQMEKLLAPIKNLPVIPDAVLQAQKNYERILASLPKNIQKKEETKIGWEDVSTQYAADLIKEKYTGFHFTTEMLFRFFNEEHLIYPNYFSSEELKTNPQLHSADDLKSIIFSALNNENPFLKLEQIFYNGTKENFALNITPEDYELIKERTKEERSGVYFTIVS